MLRPSGRPRVIALLAQFSGADLSRFAFNEVFRRGNSRYIAAVSTQHTDTTYGLADYYGFRTGELATDDKRTVTALRIDHALIR